MQLDPENGTLSHEDFGISQYLVHYNHFAQELI